MKKRIFSALLVLCMAITCLCGCGAKGPQENVIEDNYRNYYEIFVYSFYDTNGDGIGDLNGVIEKLDYIEEMGFNGIWLMPIMPSTTYHKYDVIDYFAIDDQYGTMEDFDRLVEECHKRDIRLIIDLVMNHSSSQNTWFTEACKYLRTLPSGQEPSAEECPYFDYYHFSEKRLDSTYYAVTGTDWYYEGAFWSEMPDLNLQNEAVRKEFEDIAKFWLEKGVDGFRMDAVIHFENSAVTENNEILNWFYEYCKTINEECYMVSEAWTDKGTIANYYKSLTPSFFNFAASSVEGALVKAARGKSGAATLVTQMKEYQDIFGEANPDYIDAPFLTNHDQVRVTNNLNGNETHMKMAAGLLMMMNGSPFVYYGEEIGMSSKGTKDENKRVAMIWSAENTEGMCDGPSAADPDVVSGFASVEEQLKDENSILNYYKRALALRNQNPEIARGTITIVEELCDGGQAAITKTYEDSTIAILYNTSEEEIQVDLQKTALEGMEPRGILTLCNEEITVKDGVVTMPAKSICILK